VNSNPQQQTVPSWSAIFPLGRNTGPSASAARLRQPVVQTYQFLSQFGELGPDERGAEGGWCSGFCPAAGSGVQTDPQTCSFLCLHNYCRWPCFGRRAGL